MRPCQIRSYTRRKAAKRKRINRRASQRTRELRNVSWDFLGTLCIVGGERNLGDALSLRKLCGAFLHALGSALAYQKQADSFQQICRRIHSSGEEHVGLRIVIVYASLARYQNGRYLRR